ncbi:MAG: B12-binding domain-containing radical SAM protein [Chloroflexi bacterium]|nr:B12-binding domain-containing radical SAM protein [Chloroflexota bacterium]
MRLELIAPGREEIIGDSKKYTSFSPPVNLAIVAALTPPDLEIGLTDENITAIDFEKRVDLVGITSTTRTANRAYAIADAYRAKGATVVLGGIHPTALPEEAAQHADAVVVGEAEETWPRLIADLREGQLKPFYRSHGRPDLVALPHPRRDLFAKNGYLLSNTVSTTRGCPFNCSYCSVSTFFGRTYRFRPVADIVREAECFRQRAVFFLDDNIVGNPRRAKELFRALIPLKLKWASQGSINMAKDQELLRLAAVSGCIGMFIGFESLSPDGLKSVGKSVNAVEEYEQAIRKIHSHGISIAGAFIFGLDQDDEDVFERTVRFAQKVRLELAQFNVLTPFPATALHERLEKEGRITSRDWSKYNLRTVVYEPKRMSAQRLQEGLNWSWREFYSFPSIWRRVGPFHNSLAMLWYLNGQFRTHLRRKTSYANWL